MKSPKSVWMKATRGQRTLVMIATFVTAPTASMGTPKQEIKSSQTIRFVKIIFCLVFFALNKKLRINIFSKLAKILTNNLRRMAHIDYQPSSYLECSTNGQ